MSTKHGYVVINNIVDYETYKLVKAEVGADTTYAGINREGIAKVYKNLKNGDTLIIASISNIAQRPSELYRLLNLARDKNIKIQTLDGDVTDLQSDVNNSLIDALIKAPLNLKADKVIKYPPHFLDVIAEHEAGEQINNLAKKYNIPITQIYNRIQIFKK